MTDRPAMVCAAEIAVAGIRLLADPAGGIFWPGEEALVVADLHLEKGAAFARRGVPLPPYDTPDTLGVIEWLVARYRPRTVIALGDSFHRADSHQRLPAAIARRIARLTAARRWIWVAGNHDPGPLAGLGGVSADEHTLGPFVLRHEPRPGLGEAEIAGHLHPVAKVRIRGRVLRRRCFAAGPDRVVMPALGAYAGGLNVLDPAFAFIFPHGRFHAWMLGARRVYPMAPARLVADQATPAVRRAG